MNKTALELLLLQEKAALESSLKEIEEDPSLLVAPIEIEQIAAAYEAQRYNQMLIVKRSLEDMLHKINRSLEKVKNDTYGICEKCGKIIDSERLQALPMATFCIACIS